MSTTQPLPNLTPRSEKACLLSGVEPVELIPLSVEAFSEAGQPYALQELKRNKYEETRQEAFQMVQLERERIIERERNAEASGVSDYGRGGITSDVGDSNEQGAAVHEARMIEKLKRRQQAEIEGMFLQEIKTMKVLEEKAIRARDAQVYIHSCACVSSCAVLISS